MDQLNVLNIKRGSLKARLTIFTKFVNNLQSLVELTEANIVELEQRTNRIDGLLEEFNEIQINIETLADDLEAQYTERETFESNFYAITSVSKLLISKHQNELADNNVASETSRSGSVSSDPIVGNNSNLGGIKLPTIELPKFNGNYEKWIEYRDTFESLINSNQSINKIQRFHYLRASLEGSAAQVIGSLEISFANYDIAWDILCKRYNNNRLLIHNHVQALFNIESIVKESSHKIRKLLDTITKHLRSLEILKQPIKEWDTLIIYMIVSKLDKVTTREWEQYKANNDIPTLEDLFKFLRARADLLETLELKLTDKTLADNVKEKRQNSRSFVVSNMKCAYCSKEHKIIHCAEFLKLSIPERIKAVRQNNICLNCLGGSHYANKCNFGKCKKCSRKHNTLLHLENQLENKSVESDKTTTSENNNANISLSSSNIQNQQTLLSTALIDVVDAKGNSHTVKALLDSGSQSSFISDSLRHRMNLQTKKVNIEITGINQITSNSLAIGKLTIKSKNSSYNKQISVLVIPNITDSIPSQNINRKALQIPSNVQLADPTFYKSAKIEMLIGADLFWDLLCSERKVLYKNGPILQETKLGWIIAGPLIQSSSQKIHCNFSVNLDNVDIQTQLSKFWQLEEISNEIAWSKEEIDCENHFVQNTRRETNGRFVVTIPLKEPISSLGDSRESAQKRFLSLEGRLQANSKLRELYSNFMNEYINLGHMSIAQGKSEDRQQKVSFFLPHHSVLRENSTTTKLRVVFDGSAKTTTGVSLNELQMVGPTIQPDLLSIILRFRQHSIAFTADIAKMYRQILVTPDQRSLQQILWRKSPSEPLVEYQLNTVTYGTASAPFLAIRCIKELANECRTHSPQLAQIIERDFYVDDLLSGTDSLEQAIELCSNISKVMATGKFELRKWTSNVPSLFKNSSKFDTSEIIDVDISEGKKLLGLSWSWKPDTFLFKIETQQSNIVTKRSILSSIAQIFDPLGLLAPSIIIAKLILQKLWLENISWDDTLSETLCSHWSKFYNELPMLNQLQIPRHVICEEYVELQLHGFSDASEQAYGGCIYIRSKNKLGKISVHLLCSKSRVAPLKSITLPRLELCGALLLSRLANKVMSSLTVKFENCIYWSDSTIVLSWIKTKPNSLKPFVSHRISEIQTLTHLYKWRHVPTKDNPADLLTRGVSPALLQDSNIWWNGPKWLILEPENWPSSKSEEVCDTSELRKQIKVNLAQVVELSFPYENFSNINRIKRVLAYCFRFMNNLKGKNQSGPLTSSELEASFIFLLKLIQSESFPLDIRCLKDKTSLIKGKLSNLNPILDSDGLMRVGGRLSNSNYSYEKKHPIIVSSKHYLTKLIFVNEHQRLFHVGPQQLLSSLREYIWPIGGRNLSKKVVHECIRCFRQKPPIPRPIMGDLPASRLQQSYPFSVTGVDYAGPFLIKDRKGRGSKTSKAYLCLFICFSVKALHLELVTSLTTNSFILALRRFTSRRGKPSLILSDNGTNFVGAKRELNELGKFLISNANNLVDSFSHDSLNWKFIPPHSPHFGGLWEAGVKSCKFHIKRVLGTALLTYEEFSTVLIQIEGILNSRPLFPLSSDPDDFLPITPAHFLIGRTITSIPNPDVSNIPENRLDLYQRLQKLNQHFWSRWHKEYVSELQQRSKWKHHYDDLNINDLVIIKEDNLPVLVWQLGRIVKLYPGRDGVARVADVKTSKGVIKRSFSKLCPLPSSELFKVMSAS